MKKKEEKEEPEQGDEEVSSARLSIHDVVSLEKKNSTLDSVPFKNISKLHNSGEDWVFLDSNEVDKRNTLWEVVQGYPQMKRYKKKLEQSILSHEAADLIKHASRVSDRFVGKSLERKAYQPNS